MSIARLRKILPVVALIAGLMAMASELRRRGGGGFGSRSPSR